jgi:hypothetical protein
MKALIDSGSQDNYISKEMMIRAGLYPSQKPDHEVYTALTASGRPMPGNTTIDEEVTATIQIQKRQWTISLDVLGLAAHDIVLGLPWLRESNPNIDWVNRKLSFTDQNSTVDLVPVHQQSLMTDEKMINNITSATRSSRQRLNLDIQEEEYPMSKVLEKRATPAIPSEYKQFQKLFEEELGIEALPKHQKWDHEIKLEEGKTPGFQAIYKMSEKELDTLRAYIDTMLKKGFIRRSESPAGFPVLFVPKKKWNLTTMH